MPLTILVLWKIRETNYDAEQTITVDELAASQHKTADATVDRVDERPSSRKE